MALNINVTWPEPLPQISIPIDCRHMTIKNFQRATREGHDGCDITVGNAFGADNRVCDDDRYRIDHNSQSPLQRCESNAPFERTLAIVLESPHESEYENNMIDHPLRPAMGKTGENIDEYLMHVVRSCALLHLGICRRTRVVLVNPIQFQCSLVSVIKKNKRWTKIRDRVWNALWSQQSIRDEFRSRLGVYRPDFIINACTHDIDCRRRRCTKNLECKKHKIRNFIAAHFESPTSKYEIAHPCSWQRGPSYRTLYCATTGSATM